MPAAESLLTQNSSNRRKREHTSLRRSRSAVVAGTLYRQLDRNNAIDSAQKVGQSKQSWHCINLSTGLLARGCNPAIGRYTCPRSISQQHDNWVSPGFDPCPTRRTFHETEECVARPWVRVQAPIRVIVLDRSTEEIRNRFLIRPYVDRGKRAALLDSLDQNGATEHRQHVCVEDRVDALGMLHVDVHSSAVRLLDMRSPFESCNTNGSAEQA